MDTPPLFTDDSAASPVVGVPLMVAVTVVLSSVVGTSMLDLGSATSDLKDPVLSSADVQYSDSDDRLTVVWTANQHAERLEVTVTVDGDATEVVELRRVGDTLRIDDGGLFVTGSRTVHDDGFRLRNTDTVSVTVVAIDGGQRTVVAEHTSTV